MEDIWRVFSKLHQDPLSFSNSELQHVPIQLIRSDFSKWWSLRNTQHWTSQTLNIQYIFANYIQCILSYCACFDNGIPKISSLKCLCPGRHRIYILGRYVIKKSEISFLSLDLDESTLLTHFAIWSTGESVFTLIDKIFRNKCWKYTF